MKSMGKTAAVIVDIQGDFTTLKNGSLAVEGTGRDYLDQVAAALENLKQAGLPVIATQDWHPEDHISFYTNTPGKMAFDTLEITGEKQNRIQVLWPPHCVQGTKNAQVLLGKSLLDAVVKKGTDAGFDSYSGFFDDGGSPTGLEKLLKGQGISRILMFGLATDYCVRATAMDGCRLGFKVILIENLCRGVALDTSKVALKEMADAGIEIRPELPGDLSGLSG